jgi:hypothetical protein
MNSEVIKSFLVGLGFGVDDASLSKFNKAIASASSRVALMYAGVQTAAAGIFYSISKISEGFEQMGYEYRIIAPAINKALLLRQALLAAYQAAGVNITKVVQQSVLFNYSLAKTKFAFEAIAGSVASKFFPLLTKQMDIFRSKIYANMPKIQSALTKLVEFIFKAFEGTVHLGQTIFSILGRVYDLFVDLDQKTNGWSTIVLGLLAAWKLLNLEFLATPLGMILGGLVAILALYDDFKTWSEGGKSLFDWSAALPSIENIKLALTAIRDIGMAVFHVFQGIINNDFSKLSSALNDVVNAFSKINTLMDRLVASLHSPLLDKLLNFRNSVDNAVFGGAGGAPVGGYMNPSNFATPPVNPGQAGGVSQNMQQQTTINVNGAADANSVANNVAGQQEKVNGSMYRNMRPVTQ